MLHASQDVGCAHAVRYWNSEAGVGHFARLVGSFVQPGPRRDDAEMLRALRAAVPQVLVAPAEDVEGRVVDAARSVAERLRASRDMAARHYDYCHTPTPSRPSVVHGESDRGEGELQHRMPTNPHFAKWLA